MTENIETKVGFFVEGIKDESVFFRIEYVRELPLSIKKEFKKQEVVTEITISNKTTRWPPRPIYVIGDREGKNLYQILLKPHDNFKEIVQAVANGLVKEEFIEKNNKSLFYNGSFPEAELVINYKNKDIEDKINHI